MGIFVQHCNFLRLFVQCNGEEGIKKQKRTKFIVLDSINKNDFIYNSIKPCELFL